MAQILERHHHTRSTRDPLPLPNPPLPPTPPLPRSPFPNPIHPVVAPSALPASLLPSSSPPQPRTYSLLPSFPPPDAHVPRRRRLNASDAASPETEAHRPAASAGRLARRRARIHVRRSVKLAGPVAFLNKGLRLPAGDRAPAPRTAPALPRGRSPPRTEGRARLLEAGDGGSRRSPHWPSNPAASARRRLRNGKQAVDAWDLKPGLATAASGRLPGPASCCCHPLLFRGLKSWSTCRWTARSIFFRPRHQSNRWPPWAQPLQHHLLPRPVVIKVIDHQLLRVGWRFQQARRASRNHRVSYITE